MLLSVLFISYVVKIQAQEPILEVHVPSDFSSIQEAIANVTLGGTVEVENGTYYEYVRLDKFLTLKAVNETVIIDGRYRNYPDSPWQIYVSDASNIVISGFTFLTTYIPPLACGIRIENCQNIVIANCTFKNTCHSGIELVDVSHALVFNNVVDASEMSLLIYHCTNVTVTYNTLRDADESFHMYNSRNIVFHHNNIFFDPECPHPTYPRISNTTCTWDDGRGHGNYWSDYVERYPNATQIGETWDTPYQIDPDDVDGKEHFDYYALVTDPKLPVPEKKVRSKGGGAGRNCLQ